MIRRVVLVVTVLALIGSASATAKDRYFYHRHGKAYYCVQPQTYTPGCYVVCEDTSVVRVNGYPTITTHRADSLRSNCCAPTVPSTVDCGPASPHCLPRLTHKCHCYVKGQPTPIDGTQGQLTTYCKDESFYRGIAPYEAKVPVPKICVNAKEQYRFRPITLQYDCKDADCPELDCDFENCTHDCCEVRTCEVYECVTECRMECKLFTREGTVLVAVRREPVNGQLVADIVIGRDGKMDFQEYPENTVILQAATRRQIKDAIDLDVDLSQISGNTDLKSMIN